MNEKLFGVIISIVALSLVFRHHLKRVVELLLERRGSLLRRGLPYAILVLFGVFVTITVPPPWSLPPLVVTAFSIVGQKIVRKHPLFHLVAGIIMFGVGIALYEGAVGNRDIKNEIYLWGHYLDINYEIGPALFLMAVPVIFSIFWRTVSLHLMEKRPK
jgi:hypothetical protein